MCSSDLSEKTRDIRIAPSLKPVLTVLGILLTFHFVCFCWIFFRAGDMELALAMISQVFTAFSPGILPQFIEGYRMVFLLMVTGYVLHFVPATYERRASDLVTRLPIAGKVLLLTAMIVLVIQTKSAGIQPFIYFQF